ncbi:MAG: CNNM domain-containing protein [Clostridia bacterium]|nr:CNNM domain-containing protein [Clostridia bacterium]
MRDIDKEGSNHNCRRSEGEKRAVKSSRSSAWAIKATVITFCLSFMTSMMSQVVTGYTDIIIAVMLLLFMILIAIIFDGIGVAVTSCDIDKLKNILHCDKKRAKIALKLVRNAEKVNNICADVIGDMCGVLCGACGATIAAGLISEVDGAAASFVVIAISATIAGLTVGGKACMKKLAVKNAEEYIILTAKAISLFCQDKDANKKRKKKGNK